MNTNSREDVTQLLTDWNNGDVVARDQLVTLVYGELRRMAHLRLRLERNGHTMQTGTLAHEVYLRLIKASGVPCRNRAEFFSIVARLMREILVEAARKRHAEKRGRDPINIELEDAVVATPAINLDLIALDEALHALAAKKKELGVVIDLHCFAGLTLDETADVMGVSVDTVKRQLRKAKIYLHDEMTRTQGAHASSQSPDGEKQNVSRVGPR